MGPYMLPKFRRKVYMNLRGIRGQTGCFLLSCPGMARPPRIAVINTSPRNPTRRRPKIYSVEPRRKIGKRVLLSVPDSPEYENGAAPTAPTREYLYAGGLKVATVTGSTPMYHLRDHLSVRVNTDSSGMLIGEQGHYPFGDNWYLNNSTTTKEMFTTYERRPRNRRTGSAGTGNDYAMARYYPNRLGRFSSTDPLSGNINNPQSLNHYAYSLNDPINLMDPTGMTADMTAVCGGTPSSNDPGVSNGANPFNSQACGTQAGGVINFGCVFCMNYDPDT